MPSIVERERASDRHAREVIARAAHEVRTGADLDPLLERIGDARVVMLGEASHGTSEYYTWRSLITQRLVREKGFSFLAVEGDWPDCYRVNRYLRGHPDAAEGAPRVLREFERWPTWLWANWEIVALAEWLRRHNAARAPDEMVGFYGLDVYSLWESLDTVIGYLSDHDPRALEAAKRAFGCFEPFGEDVHAYAEATSFVSTGCEEDVVRLLREARAAARSIPEGDESRLDLEQSARSVAGAERYYRTMMRGGRESWNLRDRHMVETLRDLLEHHGPDSKAIVWEHNSHIGDARATDMADSKMVNVGQLAREEYGSDDVVLVGFGSHRGSVVAGAYWGAPLETMALPPARESSWEHLLHGAKGGEYLLLSDDLAELDDEWRDQRAVGVVYDPARERFGNYQPTRLTRRYDAFLFCGETGPLHPLHVAAEQVGPPETYPWGV